MCLLDIHVFYTYKICFLFFSPWFYRWNIYVSRFRREIIQAKTSLWCIKLVQRIFTTVCPLCVRVSTNTTYTLHVLYNSLCTVLPIDATANTIFLHRGRTFTRKRPKLLDKRASGPHTNTLVRENKVPYIWRILSWWHITNELWCAV